MAHLLEARDLVKVFPGIRAVDGISFSVGLVIAARAVMVDGAGVARVLPEIVLLGGMGLVLLLIAARIFRWD